LKISAVMASPKFANPLWHLIDGKNQIVGRLATQIAHIIRGKHKPNFSANYDCGDYVVVINAQDLKFTGLKRENKKYTWHTGHPGGLKQRTVKQQMEKCPEEVRLEFSFKEICFKYHFNSFRTSK
jgi:large subunit ribosomal protein L13